MRSLLTAYSNAHDSMRNVDGLQPQEAFDEILKYLFFREHDEEHEPLTLVPDSSSSVYIRQCASDIRGRFGRYVEEANSFFSELWKDQTFLLSDEALYLVHSHLQGFRFADIDADIRSAALQQFVTPEVRRGLGIFLTPDVVVREAVEALEPKTNSKVLDPACGAGTFLIHVLKFCAFPKKAQMTVYGSDKSPRMLTIADLNLSHSKRAKFKRALVDSLSGTDEDFLKAGHFDYILTNPPFGVDLDARAIDFRRYQTGLDKFGYPLKHQDSDVLFLERCLQLLRPGGELAIVMPRSFMTNSKLEHARTKLGLLGHVWGLMTLPPETFSGTGTQTTTAVLFVRRYKNEKERSEENGIVIGRARNVGFDTTGRKRENADIIGLGKEIRTASTQHKTFKRAQFVGNIVHGDSFNRLADLIADRPRATAGASFRRLGDVTTVISTGLTPARADYSDDGLFLVKVGNLTGAGIDWIPRDRNFIDPSQFAKRERSKRALIIQLEDILLTSSAHTSKYIAKKSDIVTDIPAWAGGRASFVGEVMLIRADRSKIDPFRLLGFIRHPQTIERIQLMVRGQTAHLHPDDMLNLPIPDIVLDKTGPFERVAKLIREEGRIAQQVTQNAHQQLESYSEILFG